MAELFDMKELEERVILVAVSTSDEDDTEASLDELEELADTAGATAIGRLVQNREKIHPGTYLGSGKIGELREMVWEMGATGVICDDELSPAQLRNLESALDTKVMDRTMVILDIFAAHATTSEGKIQVELAQLRYRAARLVGLRSSLSRLGGGIGTRGPGEKKLEMDRRLIHERIGQLKSELEDVKRHREVTRKQRDRKYTLSAAIVGYTNAGKSTLLNCLTGSDIPANDRLFDTLDTTTRRLRLDESQEVLLSDTVGFIRKLPTHLIEAFKATLEELSYADVLLHVIDISNPEWEAQARVVDGLISQLGASETPCLRVFNKCDAYIGILPHGDDIVCISAKSGEGADALVSKLLEMLDRGKKQVRLEIPYSDAGIVDLLKREAAVLSMEYTDTGITAEAIVTPDVLGRVKKYIPGYVEPKEDWE